MITKILTKPGQATTAPCGCIITYGYPLREDEQPSGPGSARMRPVHRVSVHKCDACKEYEQQRNKMIPRALELAPRYIAEAHLKGRKMTKTVAFLMAMDDLMKGVKQ